MTGPKQAIGKEEEKIATTQRGRCLLGTSSEIATVKERCTAPESPASVFAPIRSSTCLAVAPMMAPTRAKTLPPMKNQRRPKMSERRPTIRKPTDRPSVKERATQEMFTEGPMSASMTAREFDGKIHPRKLEMFPRQRP